MEGLTYISNFLTTEEQEAIVSKVDQNPWLTDLKRRVQHYGYKYDYKARAIDHSMYLGPLPAWANLIRKYINSKKITNVEFDQLIVNEYEPGQGISRHIDCQPCFSNTIVSVSLLSPCMMDFLSVAYKELEHQWLEVGSLLMIKDEARYEWYHGISARKSDTYQGEKMMRKRRISLTFRKALV